MATATVPPGTNADFDTLISELNHRIWEVRRDACEDLALLGDKRAIPHLSRLLNDGVGAVRFAAAEAIGKFGDRSVIPDLLRLLDNERWGAYGPVIESLASLRAKEAIPYFIKFLRDRDPRVRGLSANALMVVTRQVIPFKAKGSEEDRERAVQQWETWWQKNQESFQ